MGDNDDAMNNSEGAAPDEDDPFREGLRNGTLDPDVLLAVRNARDELSEDEIHEVIKRSIDDASFQNVLTRVMQLYHLTAEFGAEDADNIDGGN